MFFPVVDEVSDNLKHNAMAAIHREAIQKQIQQDWANREYIEVITGNIKKITDFLNSFGRLREVCLKKFLNFIVVCRNGQELFVRIVVD